MSNFSPFPKYFQYISNFRSQITYFIREIWIFDFFPQFYKSDMSKYGYLEVFQESPFDFEITRVDCIYYARIKKINPIL